MGYLWLKLVAGLVATSYRHKSHGQGSLCMQSFKKNQEGRVNYKLLGGLTPNCELTSKGRRSQAVIAVSLALSVPWPDPTAIWNWENGRGFVLSLRKQTDFPPVALRRRKILFGAQSKRQIRLFSQATFSCNTQQLTEKTRGRARSGGQNPVCLRCLSSWS